MFPINKTNVAVRNKVFLNEIKKKCFSIKLILKLTIQGIAPSFCRKTKQDALPISLENVSEDILIVSYIGFEEQEVAIKGRKYVKVILKENSQLLDEVVVVGYGAQKKVNLTGAVASLDVKQLESRPITSASQSLAGIRYIFQRKVSIHISNSSLIASF